ncbi:hypothetical protein [Tepidibacter mesophilus]|uniref:hypothetical protein n=1 Tax=Tepidibacter mesophilus TaxID=655607 RepID=UPI000C06944B|nr:hypothetical protein [Tepidibacter mesophilus]
MNKYLKKAFIILAILFICMITKFVYFNLNNNIDSNNIISLQKNITEKCTEYTTISLNDITSFEWEKVYFFAPYSSKKDIFKTIGFRCGGITETTNEGMMQIIFVNKNKMVCNIFGYQDTFAINSSQKVLLSSEKPRFIVTKIGKENDKIRLDWYDSNLVQKSMSNKNIVSQNKVGVWKSESKIRDKNNIIEKSNEFIVSKEGIVVGFMIYNEFEKSTGNFINQYYNSYVGYLNDNDIKCKTEKDNQNFELKFDRNKFDGNISLSGNTSKLNGHYIFTK